MDTDEALRASLHEAFATARAHPALRARVVGEVAGAARAGRGRRWTAVSGGVAAAAALVAVAAGLIATHRPLAGGVPPLPAPAAAPPVAPAGSLQLATRVGFGCMLPLTVDGHPATVSLPDGAITRSPQAATVGRGPGGAAFVNGQWLVGGTAAVSPDGGSYAYTVDSSGVPGASESSQIMVRDASGHDREVWRGGGYVQLAGWTGGGIVFVLQPQGDGLGVTEVRVVDPAHPGSTRRIGPNPPLDSKAPHPGQLPLFTGTALIGDGAIWTTYDPQPAQLSSGVRGPNEVARMDLQTGQVSTWYTAPAGNLAEMIGLDAHGLPVLVVSPATYERIRTTPPPTPPLTLEVLTGRDQAQPVAGAGRGVNWSAAFGDAHGTWITSQDALWLLDGGGLQRVGTMPPGSIAAIGTGIRVVGGCQ
jgi:hypothetical protein